MDEPLAVALKFGFLAVLYLFLLWVARSALRDLGGSTEPVTSIHAAVQGDERAGARYAGPLDGVEPRLEVIAALGYRPGAVVDVGEGALLGRADSADVKVDDPFASSAHARIFERDGYMQIEDMGSTNGTYLNGRKLRAVEQLKVADVIRIGDSEYRYEE
jgi:hypothetical protein